MDVIGGKYDFECIIIILLLCVFHLEIIFTVLSACFRYNSAKKDNDFIYHESVPGPDTLGAVKGILAALIFLLKL